jgi:cyclomaltodextrinase / maltogenic alpha-amylase / neopullulanase
VAAGDRSHRIGPAALVAAFVMAACTSTRTSGGSSAPTTSAEAVVAFDMRGGDAFSWQERVTGTARCSSVQLVRNGGMSGHAVAVSDGRFAATVPLGPGSNQIEARCADPGAPAAVSAPIVFNERLQPGPLASIAVSATGDEIALDGHRSRPGPPDEAPIVRYRWHADPRHASSLTLASGDPLTSVDGQRLVLRAPGSDGEYYVSLTVTDSDGRSDTSTTYFVVSDGAPRAVDMMHEHPSWIDRAVVYAPIPALWGGGPRAVDRKLRYLKELGVDALWLWPPAERRAAGEEYAITSYFKLDRSWGPASAFRKMVGDAHALGMHVLLDIVPNHMSDESPYFRDAKRYGTASHYYDFFDRDAQGAVTHYFDWTNLPNLNYDNPEVRRMIVDAFVHWVRDFGIDGFRVDAAWGVERRRPSFWPELRRAITRVDPDVLMLAEGSAVDPYFFSHGFDVAYDWTKHPGQWAWTSAFDFPTETGALLGPALTNAPKGYAPNAIVLRFINNNDTGARFVDQYGVATTRVAATLQFTVPGMPAMFAGDEIGASYMPYSNLTPIPWKDRHGLRPLYRRLIELKHTVPSLSSHTMDLLQVSADSALAYLRPASGGPPVLVLLNFGPRQPQLTIDKTPELAAVVGNGSMRDLLTGKRVRLRVAPTTVGYAMPPKSMFVLVPGGS